MKQPLPPAQKEGYRSFFKFKDCDDDGLVVYFKRIEPGIPDPQWIRVGKVKDSREFMMLAQGEVEMQDNNTWAEPKEWSID